MEEAVRLYHEALHINQSGNITQAIEMLERAVKLDPKYADGLEALGVLYEKANRLENAIETMKELSRVNPNHVMAHANLSRFYVQKGLILEAEQEQAEARRLSWKAELQVYKNQMSSSANPEEEERKRLQEIESRMTRYRKAIELDPNDVLGYFSLGSVLLEAKRLAEALEAFRKAVTVNPEHSPSFFNLGLTLESLGNKEEAIQIYEQGMKVAEKRGDMIPLKKMTARLTMLRDKK